MGIITDDMRRVIAEQKLCFAATVAHDGTANLSPKGTIAVWDDNHLAFADVSSPNSVANLRRNPSIEINVVDQTLRKGYRFKGKAEVFASGPRFDDLLKFYRDRGTTLPIRSVVLIAVDDAAELWSPAYDSGATEREVVERWDRHWDELRARRKFTV
jgi:predicted pyridoxine 5'-phosphate oxidase superfamily flavin-nucleotide-binding protein